MASPESVKDADAREILIVEDDAAIARLMQMHVQAAGYEVRCCADGVEAMELLQRQHFHLVVLDRMLPGADGMRVLRYLRRPRAGERIPVLIVTALGQTADRIHGLNEGADDYLPKPFEPDELVARIRALLRRAMPESAVSPGTGGIEIDADVPVVRAGGREMILRPLEHRLLRCLMQNPGKTRSREYLLDHVWGRDVFVEPRTVDVTIKRLRKALKEIGVGDCVQTVRGLGYRFYPLREEGRKE